MIEVCEDKVGFVVKGDEGRAKSAINEVFSTCPFGEAILEKKVAGQERGQHEIERIDALGRVTPWGCAAQGFLNDVIGVEEVTLSPGHGGIT
ncbi:hypothetical protein AA0535_1964 [Asaia krungthepensis NRIC 0535]|uniref:Uncharacterized protein n=1 Tax=Asaia krungthepensis NRIC 0535 TaxID=1307925 RepID=A0ABQ0Q3U6_9PROT|nr:hypothetical protein AA0535_1964 [Asaia krungthepensis NRIC 0535]